MRRAEAAAAVAVVQYIPTQATSRLRPVAVAAERAARAGADRSRPLSLRLPLAVVAVAMVLPAAVPTGRCCRG